MRSEVATNHEPRTTKRGGRSGQAMVETAIVLVVLVFAFFAVFQFADNLRAKLLVDYAALRCARARAVGYNDYTILKTARLCTLAAAGPARLKNDNGSAFSTGEILVRMRNYLGARTETQARHLLDYEYWDFGVMPYPETLLSSSRMEATVRQSRPQFFVPWERAGEDDGVRAELVGKSAVEAHYPDYLNGK